MLYRWFDRAGFNAWGNAIVGSALFVLWHYTHLEPIPMLVLFAPACCFSISDIEAAASSSPSLCTGL